jgi:UDP-2,4-diacetamido-2,4,6-trideoxy-beta-L-altropyranose hydrolase
MRCLALAQAWQDFGGDAVFAVAEALPAIAERLRAERMQVRRIASVPGSAQDAAEVTRIAAEQHASWVVVDGYQFDASYQSSLKQAGLKVLVVDDMGECEHYCADLVMNQNTHACEDMYVRREPHTRLLLGPRYAMLRREFNSWREWQREIPPAGRKVLVTMGGSDPDNVTSLVMAALHEIGVEGVTATVVAGAGNPHFAALERTARNSGGTLRLVRNVDNMPELMAWADIAIIAGGGTLWELLYVGCPVMSFARNPLQTRVVSQLHREGVVQDLGCPSHASSAVLASLVSSLAASQAFREEMSVRGRQYIDGTGAHRVCEWLANCAHPEVAAGCSR